MAFTGQPYRVHYIAKSFQQGLSDVRMVVYKPNGVKQGVYTLIELNAGDGKGIYYHDYEDSDLEGTYLFVIDCLSNPKKDARQVYFSDRSLLGWSVAEKNQIRDALGVDGDKIPAVGGQLQAGLSNLLFLKNIEGGRWKRTGTQMIFYAEDNITEVARFNLLCDAGSPAGVNDDPFERVRV